jgi:N-acylneuraminate cytidylyltransferase
MTNIAIIPARGGSKRIPHKNLKLFLSKPIISYAITNALDSQLFDNVIVSTDSHEIAELSKSYGAQVPFMRSKQNSNDFATTDDLLKEVINDLICHNYIFNNFCCIYPTSPLLTIKNIKISYDLLLTNNYDGVFGVTEFSYPIQRGLNVVDGKARMIWPENKQKRSQDLDTTYHDSGQFYWSTKQSFLKHKSLWTDNTGVIILSNIEVQDIDTITDWKIAELKYSILNE